MRQGSTRVLIRMDDAGKVANKHTHDYEHGSAPIITIPGDMVSVGENPDASNQRPAARTYEERNQLLDAPRKPATPSAAIRRTSLAP